MICNCHFVIRLIFLSILFFCFTPITSAALNVEMQIKRGNKSYAAAEYKQAVKYYLLAIGEGASNGHVYYNLGNAYYRLGKIGRAISAYRRAQKQLPRDADIAANLALARRKTIDQLKSDGEISISGFVGRFFSWTTHLSVYEQKLLLVFSFLTFVTVFIFETFFSNHFLQIARYLSLAFSFLFFVISTSFYRGVSDEIRFKMPGSEKSFAVITEEKAKVYSGDGNTYQVVFVLHDGAEVSLGEQRDGWVEVLLPSGRKGWVEVSNVDIL